MTDIKLQLVNYKLFSEKEIEVKDAEVLIIAGPNEKGKTSIITALTEAWALKGFTPDPLKKGAEEGYTAITGPDKDGNPITIIHNFNKFDKSGSFYAIDRYGKTIKTITRIRELLGVFNVISLEEVYYMMKSADSRKRFIRDYIMPLIPADVLAEIEKINLEINETKGTLFLKRKQANADVSTYGSLLKNYKELTEEEKHILATGDKYQAAIDALDAELEKTREVSSKGIEAKAMIATIENKIEAVDNNIKGIQEDLIDLEFRMNQKKVQLSKEKDIKEQLEKDLKSVVVPEYDEKKVESLKSDISRGRDALNKYKELYEATKAQNNIQKQLETAKKDAEDLDGQIFQKRQHAKKLLEKAELPKGLSLEEDKILLNDFDLSDTQVSESAAKLALAEMLCKLSTARFIVMGNLGAFDDNRFPELVKIAQGHNKIVVLESVDNSTEDIKVITTIKDV